MKVRCFSMFMRNQQGQKQQIYLQNFSQVVVDPNSHIIFCLNYLDLQFRLCALYGYPRPEHCNSQKCEEVEMFMLKFQNLNEYNRIYFQYSTYFNQQNNILYLYWPYEWNPIEQAQHILLSSKYQPRLVNKIKIIKFDALNKLVPNFIDLNYRVDNN